MHCFTSKKVLLFGASGMLGGYLIKILPDFFEIYSPKPRAEIVLEKTRNIHWLSNYLDISDVGSVEGLLCDSRPDVIINCIAVTPRSNLANCPVENIKTNSLFPHFLANLAREKNCNLIHMSTDGVFSGERGSYSECDLPDPHDLYGRSKLLGEVSQDRCVTLRTSFYGLSQNKQGLINWLISQRGTAVTGYKNYVFSGIPLSVLAKAIISIIQRPTFPNGLYHLGGPSISKYDLLTTVSEILRLDITVEPCFAPCINRSLNSSQFWKMIGHEMPTLKSMIDEIHIEFCRDYV